jgi:hypothetical protein
MKEIITFNGWDMIGDMIRGDLQRRLSEERKIWGSVLKLAHEPTHHPCAFA